MNNKIINIDEIINAFTDAACYNNGAKDPTKPQYSCSACVFILDDVVIYGNYNFSDNATNSYGELLGVYIAILDYIDIYTKSQMEIFPQMVIHSDSGYVVNSLNVWIYGWRKRAVKGTSFNSSNKEVSYYGLIDLMRNLMDEYQIKIKHVKGHVDLNTTKDIKKAIKACKSINGYEPCLDEIQYNSTFNDIVDRYAVQCLKDVMGGRIDARGNNSRFIEKFKQFIC